LDPEVVTYTNFPDGSTVIDVGRLPVPNGDPETAVRAPVAGLTLNAEMWLKLMSGAYKKLPEASIATELACPVGNGEPGIAIKAPLASRVNAEMS